MDFKDNVLQLAERIKKQKDAIQTEEATKNAFIMPIITALGYDVFNPFEVVPEMDCDLTRKGDKIDYAIKKDGRTILLIECKHCKQNLDLHNTQLSKYYAASNARFGVLTNGIEYRFYADLDKTNIMDEKPFLVVNMLDLSDAYIEELFKNSKTNYANMMRESEAHFLKFLRGDVRLVDITPELIEQYAAYLEKKNWSRATLGIVMRNTRTIINRAIKKRKVSYNVHPFVDYSIPQSPVRDVSIRLESLSKILNAEVDSNYLSVARDLFSLSFYLGGINMTDLMDMDFRNSRYIQYSRKKIMGRTSNANVIILPVHEKAACIIAKWMNPRTGKLDFHYNFTYKNFSRHISRGIAKLAKELGIKERVVYYSARKTFAQLASELGIPDGVIDYCLGHSDKSRGVIRYYAKVREKQAEIAINRVIDYVDHPEKYKEFLEMRADIMLMKS